MLLKTLTDENTKMRKFLFEATVHSVDEEKVVSLGQRCNEDKNSPYFESYSNYSIHEEMLKDSIKELKHTVTSFC